MWSFGLTTSGKRAQRKSHDACGIAICYISGSVKILHGIAKDQHYEVCPEVRTALLLRVVAPPNGEILASTVRGLLYQPHDLGMEFGKISYDSWSAYESIQIPALVRLSDPHTANEIGGNIPSP